MFIKIKNVSFPRFVEKKILTHPNSFTYIACAEVRYDAMNFEPSANEINIIPIKPIDNPLKIFLIRRKFTYHRHIVLVCRSISMKEHRRREECMYSFDEHLKRYYVS